MCQIWEHVPNWVTHPPFTPLWEHKNLGTLGTQKFRNILLFEDPPLDEFGNIDFGITRCFDSQGPKLGG